VYASRPFVRALVRKFVTKHGDKAFPCVIFLFAPLLSPHYATPWWRSTLGLAPLAVPARTEQDARGGSDETGAWSGEEAAFRSRGHARHAAREAADALDIDAKCHSAQSAAQCTQGARAQLACRVVTLLEFVFCVLLGCACHGLCLYLFFSFLSGCSFFLAHYGYKPMPSDFVRISPTLLVRFARPWKRCRLAATT
jgi:hypothetical protein